VQFGGQMLEGEARVRFGVGSGFEKLQSREFEIRRIDLQIEKLNGDVLRVARDKTRLPGGDY